MRDDPIPETCFEILAELAAIVSGTIKREESLLDEDFFRRGYTPEARLGCMVRWFRAYPYENEYGVYPRFNYESGTPLHDSLSDRWPDSGREIEFSLFSILFLLRSSTRRSAGQPQSSEGRVYWDLPIEWVEPGFETAEDVFFLDLPSEAQRHLFNGYSSEEEIEQPGIRIDFRFYERWIPNWRSTPVDEWVWGWHLDRSWQVLTTSETLTESGD